VNKFFTLALGVILVLVGKGIVWGQMTTETIQQPPVIPVATTTSSGLPKPLALTRFDALQKKSPFTLASATAEAEFAKDLFLGGYVRMNGQDYVMVTSTTKGDRILVGMKESPSAQGMILLELINNSSGDLSMLQAKIKKGTEMATLKYEPKGGSGTPVAPIPTPVTPIPYAPQTQPGSPTLSGQKSVQGQVNSGGIPNTGGTDSLGRTGRIYLRRGPPISEGVKK
jgi:hypothetical protein